MTNKEKLPRDEFSLATKRVMAERVAWRCSFPNCHNITIGPKKDDNNKSLNLGEAAHIAAAASDGPRYDFQMTKEQRKSISNGIWMCRPHARFIDADFKEFSVATLSIWKKQAEELAYQNLMKQSHYHPEVKTILIAIGTNLLFWGTWKSVKNQTWTFEVSSYLTGSSISVRGYANNFSNINSNQKFVIVESQGDARHIVAPLEIAYTDAGKELITIELSEKVLSTSPKKVGIDLKIGDDGDLEFLNGDISIVTGIDAAIQRVSITAGTIYGEISYDPELGSHISEYYQQYHHNEALLARLIKIELIRLSLVPRITETGISVYPPLSFIKEVVQVGFSSIVLVNSRLEIDVSLILGDDSRWNGKLKIFVKSEF